MTHTTDHREPISVDIPGALRLCGGGIGRTKLFELIDSGQLKSINIGKRRLISVASIRALVDGPPDAA